MRKNIYLAFSGIALILFAVLSVILFIELTINFNYPQVLKLPAYNIIYELAESAPSTQVLWLAYALVPILLIPSAIAFNQLLGRNLKNIMNLATVFAVLGVFCMVLGLLRWPSLNYYLASFYKTADSTYKNLIELVYYSFNIYAGKFIGEVLAETFINLWFIFIGISFFKGETKNTAIGVLCIVVALLGSIGIYNTATIRMPVFYPVTSFLIPLWSFVLGIVLIWYSRKIKD